MIQELLASAAEYDTVLFENEDVLVTAALGGFVPNWLILWPKQTSQTICSAFPLWRFPQDHLLRTVLTTQAAKTALWFEHGSSTAGNAIGCGVDYAHLHVLLNPPVTLGQFRRHATVRAGHDWPAWNTGQVEEGRDYHAFGRGADSYLATDTQALGSQFFRRILAGLTGHLDVWDYRKHSFASNGGATNRYVREHRDHIFRV